MALTIRVRLNKGQLTLCDKINYKYIIDNSQKSKWSCGNLTSMAIKYIFATLAL